MPASRVSPSTRKKGIRRGSTFRATTCQVYDTGCAAASRPGAGLTSQQAASFAAARVLECLEGREASANHWLWVEQPIGVDDDRLQKGLTLHHTTFSPRPGCAVCGA